MLQSQTILHGRESPSDETRLKEITVNVKVAAGGLKEKLTLIGEMGKALGIVKNTRTTFTVASLADSEFKQSLADLGARSDMEVNKMLKALVWAKSSLMQMEQLLQEVEQTHAGQKSWTWTKVAPDLARVLAHAGKVLEKPLQQALVCLPVAEPSQLSEVEGSQRSFPKQQQQQKQQLLKGI